MFNLPNEKKYGRIVQTIANRFETYGYEKLKVDAFERYELYANVKTEMNVKETIKVTDYDGELLVVRPDVTLPIAYKYAKQLELAISPSYERYYYVEEVFRQSFEASESIEKMQMGVECFNPSSPLIDAETIALASHALDDLNVTQHQFEIGFATFLKDLLAPFALQEAQVEKIESYVRAKNMAELATYIQTLNLDKETANIIANIPTYYGNFETIAQRLEPYVSNEAVKATLDYLKDVDEYLQLFGVEQHVVFDFGLINRMDYYSHLIFQAYVDGVGKPVLMGGRYDQLGERFGASFPAVGFAFDLDRLMEAVSAVKEDSTAIEITIITEQAYLKEAVQLANELRNRNFEAVIGKNAILETIHTVTLGEEIVLTFNGTTERFEKIDDCIAYFIDKQGAM
ncbi:MAG TPA: ATP phosphoribosyltransferase regulatory subunit [Savagea sp.]